MLIRLFFYLYAWWEWVMLSYLLFYWQASMDACIDMNRTSGHLGGSRSRPAAASGRGFRPRPPLRGGDLRAMTTQLTVTSAQKSGTCNRMDL